MYVRLTDMSTYYMCVEIKGQTARTGSSLLPCGSLRSNPSHEALQTHLPTKPVSVYFIKLLTLPILSQGLSAANLAFQ